MRHRKHYQDKNDSKDRQLLEKVAAGDRRAFQQLYTQYYKRLTHFLYPILKQTPLVEEVINDVMLAVWNQAGVFEGRSKVSTWIMGIAYRRGAKSWQREIKHTPTTNAFIPGENDIEDAAPPANDDQATMRSKLEEWEWQQLIQSSLATLSNEHRLALELSFYFGYSCEEIAEIMGCPPSTVKTRLFYARKKLRLYIETTQSIDYESIFQK